jgi:hypothetical protein
MMAPAKASALRVLPADKTGEALRVISSPTDGFAPERPDF